MKSAYSQILAVVVGLAPILAVTPCDAEDASVHAQAGSGMSSQTPAALADTQTWERALSLTDEILVQFALAKGLDPIRAEALRDIYRERRRSRRLNIADAASGRITGKELRTASARDQADVELRIGKLLTPEEMLTLDADEARMHAVEILRRLDSKGN